MSDPNIIIKSADKGGAIVVQDTSKYQSEILSQLQNTKFYKKLPNDPTNNYQSEILSFLTNAITAGWISQSEFKFLYCQYPIRPVFYTLPKILIDSLILQVVRLWHKRILFYRLYLNTSIFL